MSGLQTLLQQAHLAQHLNAFTNRLRWVRHLKHLLLIILGGVLVQVLHHGWIDALGHTWMLAVVAVFSLVGICFMFALVMEEMENVQQAVKTQTKFIALDEHGSDRLYAETAKIIAKAKREIFAVNSFLKEEFQASEHSRRKYFNTLIEKSHLVDYVRILQIDDGESVSELFNQSYIKHFKDMLARIDAPDRTIELLRVSPKYPSTFLIIDDEWLVLQLNEVSGSVPLDAGLHEGGARRHLYQLRGILIVHDPNHFFLEDFQTTFRVLHNHAQKIINTDSLA